MERATRAADRLLAHLTRSGDPRRDWLEALRSEAAAMPPGSGRLWWLLGGIWLAIQGAHMVRRLGMTAAGIAVGATLVWLDWHPGSKNPAMPTDRVTLILIAALLLVLPWATRPLLGRVADNRAARAVRFSGYPAIYALLFVIVGLSRFAGSRFDDFHAFDQANWESDMRSGAVFSAIILTATVGGYAIGVLALTSRRMALPPLVLVLGAGLGLGLGTLEYVLMPTGHPWLATPAWATAIIILVALVAPPAAIVGVSRFVIRRGTRQGLRGGILAGLCIGGVGALVLATLTIGTMLLAPQAVTLEWANPDPTVPHGTPFEIQMSVSDAAVRYLFALIVGPACGLVLGAIASGSTAEPPGDRPSVPIDQGPAARAAQATSR
jgi:hypothetical protein